MYFLYTIYDALIGGHTKKKHDFFTIYEATICLYINFFTILLNVLYFFYNNTVVYGTSMRNFLFFINITDFNYANKLIFDNHIIKGNFNK